MTTPDIDSSSGGPAAFSWPEVFTDEQLQQQLRTAEGREAALGIRARYLGDIATQLAVSRALRAGNILNTSQVLSERLVTDKYNYDDSSPRAPETVKGRNTYGRVMDKFSDRFSPLGSNGGRIMDEATSVDLPTPGRMSYLDRRAMLRTSERAFRQEVRRAHSRHAELVAGGGIGLGKQAKTRSRVLRRGLNSDARADFLDGDISAREYQDRVRSNRAKEVIVPTAAVRRHVRKERRLGMASLVRANQVVRHPVRSVRRRVNNRRIDGVNSQLDEVRSRRADLEAEARRRHLIEEDDS